MNRPWAPIFTFFLGVVLTVGVYEGARAITNARRALRMASNQMQGVEAPAANGEGAATARGPARAVQARPTANRTTANRNPVDRTGAAQPSRLPQANGTAPAVSARAKTAKTVQERRDALKERLANLTPEEREALMAKRAARKDRQRQRLMALKAMRQAQQDGGDAPDLPFEEDPGGGLDDLVDTAEPQAPE